MEIVLVWLAIMTAVFHSSQAMCADGGSDGDIRVTGIHTTNLVAGRIEICAWEEWRAVCHANWDKKEVMVVCRQLGFPTAGALFCMKSCFGKTEGQSGLFGFDCNGREAKLYDCLHTASNTSSCGEGAGVVCTNGTAVTVLPNTGTTPPEPTTMETDTTTSTSTSSDEGSMTAGVMQESCPSLAALGGGLGVLSAILAILLVGVVMGWVWSYHRKRNSRLQERALASQTGKFPNPTYSPTFISDQVQYSTIGPRDSNHNPSHVVNGAMPSCHIDAEKKDLCEGGGTLEHPEQGEGEVTYEVPISTTQALAAMQPLDREYSILQHM